MDRIYVSPKIEDWSGCTSILAGFTCWETCPSGWNWMEDAENRLIAKPAPIGTDRLGGQRCKYAEKSHMYKYDLGHISKGVVALL